MTPIGTCEGGSRAGGHACFVHVRRIKSIAAIIIFIRRSINIFSPLTRPRLDTDERTNETLYALVRACPPFFSAISLEVSIISVAALIERRNALFEKVL